MDWPIRGLFTRNERIAPLKTANRICPGQARLRAWNQSLTQAARDRAKPGKRSGSRDAASSAHGHEQLWDGAPSRDRSDTRVFQRKLVCNRRKETNSRVNTAQSPLYPARSCLSASATTHTTSCQRVDRYEYVEKSLYFNLPLSQQEILTG